MPDQNVNSSLPWPALIALFLALGGGAAFYFSALNSDRPDFAPGNPQSLGNEDVEARLWQDPFQAVDGRQQLDSWSASINLSTDSLAQLHGSLASKTPNGETNSQVRPAGVHAPTVLKNAAVPWPALHSLEMIEKEIEDAADMEATRTAKGSVLILPVMVQADAYPEIAEQRLRTRVAILEALGIGGYKPVDTVHIGFFKMKWPSARVENRRPIVFPPDAWEKNQSADLVVPYEWCESGGVPMAGTSPPTKLYKRALVLWLNENVFYDLPVRRLGLFLENIIPSGTTADVRIVGPFISTTLHAMVEEAGKIDMHPNPNNEATEIFPFEKCATIRMYSPWATASDAALQLGANCERNPIHPGQTIADYLSKSFSGGHDGLFTFARTTHTDWDLCQELVVELCRRNVKIPTGETLAFRAPTYEHRPENQEIPHPAPELKKPNPDCIALIGEWDTVYGRALPLTFAAAASGAKLNDLVDHSATFPPWIRPFVYLRGIDGKMAHSSSELPGEGSLANEKSQSSKRGNLKINGPDEQPEGMNQSDYLRRLADHIAAWDSYLRNRGQRLAAVGVIGTDLYDKLLVMRAVRDRLPTGVIFFTTDLDARYNLASEWRTSHNLVVCSSYGLRLNQYYQGNIPPFRDSLQTAAFAATLRAVDCPRLAADGLDRLLDWPRVFEIGRTGAFDLSIDAKVFNEDLWETGQAMPKEPPTLQPPREDLRQWWNEDRVKSGEIMLGGLALLIAIPLVLGLRPAKIDWRQLIYSSRVFVSIAVVITFFCIAPLVWLHEIDEPFAWAEGVSVWPTEAIRILVILLCVHLYFKSRYDVAESAKDIHEKFKLKTNPSPGPFWATFRRSYGKWKVFGKDGFPTQRFTSVDEVKPKALAKVYARNVWKEYRRRADYRMRCIRFVSVSAAYFLVAYCLMSLLGMPNPPVRGQAVATWDLWITMISVFAAIALTFYAIDATLLNAKIIRLILQCDTHWPNDAQKQFQRNHIDVVELTEYLDIHFIAMRTDVVGKMVYYPFLIFFMMIVSRISLFDNWAWPPGLIIVMAVNVILAIVPAYHLRNAAEQARDDALLKIRERRTAALKEGSEARGAAFEALAKEVEDERRGAFSILSQYPLVAAILLPSSGIGLWVILEQLAQNFAGAQ